MHSFAGVDLRRFCHSRGAVRHALFAATVLILSGAMHASISFAAGDKVAIRDDAPSQYTVVKGDTLWGVAERFLNDPWRWPEIWKANSHISDPDLIFPGDLVVMDEDGSIRVLRNNKVAASTSRLSDNRTIKLSPSIYSEALQRAIPVISPRAIQPFLTVPLVYDEGQMDEYAYVAMGVDDNVIIGKYQQFYVRGLLPSDEDVFQVFRSGRPFVDPDSDEVLGHEAIYLGDARLIEYGETSRLELTHSRQEIGPKDRLIPAPATSTLPYYFPHSPEQELSGRIISAHEGVSELGRHSVVVVNLGDRDGLQSGHVLRVLRHKGVSKDPVTGKDFEVPDQSTGLLMVFRTFEKLSYALVMKSSRPVHILDAVVTP